MPDHDVNFKLISEKECSLAVFKTYFSFNKDIWIALSDYKMYFYLIVLFLLATILQFINFTVSYILFSLLINAIFFLLNCLVLILYLYIHFLFLKHYFPY